MADGLMYKDSPSWGAYEEALKTCNWDWNNIEDEDERESQRLLWEDMEDHKIALTIAATQPRLIPTELKKIIELHNKYAPSKHELRVP